MRILFYGESPILETGAARVDRHLLDSMVELGIEVEVLGTSHFFGDEYDHERYPFKITGVEGKTQVETHANALQMILDRDGTFDMLFVSGDMHVPNIMAEGVKKYPTIVLAAIDGEVRHPDQIMSLEYAKVPAVYSKYSYNQVLKHMPGIKDKFKCIQLGCEPDVFYPLSEEERREYRRKAFNIGDDTFLVMCANRNQVRKDLGRCMRAFHLFHENVLDSKIYMHCRQNDVGGNIINQAILLGLDVRGEKAETIFTGPDYTEISGYDREKLNKMYNAADVCISSAQGEGWGLTTTEAMAAGTPFIGPANTTFFEILGLREQRVDLGFHKGERGLLVECGGDDLWSIYYGTDDAPRPITSVVSLSWALDEVYKHRHAAKERAYQARKWTEQHTWDKFKVEWKELLSQCQAHLLAV